MKQITSDHVEIIATFGPLTRCRCRCGKYFIVLNSVVKARRSCGCTKARSQYLTNIIKRKEDRRKLISQFLATKPVLKLRTEWVVKDALHLKEKVSVIKNDIYQIKKEKERLIKQKRKQAYEAKQSAISIAKAKDEGGGERLLQVSVLAQDTQVASDPRTTLPLLRSTGIDSGGNRGGSYHTT